MSSTKANPKYSQFNEEEVLARILKVVGSGNKTCAEFGGGNGLNISNTAHLIRHHDWTGTFIDCRPGAAHIVMDNYGDLPITAIEAVITKDNINDLLPQDLFLASIDIDGNDYHVWEAIRQKPTVVIIEYNPTKKEDWVMGYDPEYNWKKDKIRDRYGASEKAMVRLGESKGYELVDKNRANLFFVRVE